MSASARCSPVIRRATNSRSSTARADDLMLEQCPPCARTNAMVPTLSVRREPRAMEVDTIARYSPGRPGRITAPFRTRGHSQGYCPATNPEFGEVSADGFLAEGAFDDLAARRPVTGRFGRSPVALGIGDVI